MSAITTPTKQTDRLFNSSYILVCFIYLFFLSGASMLLAVLPLYVGKVGGSISAVGIVIGSLGLTIIPVELFVGRLIDIKGRKPILITASFILVTSFLAFNFVTSLPLLIVAQLFRGIGMGCFFPTSMALVADLAPPRRLAEAIAYVTALFSVSQAIAPPVGILLANSFGFSSVFSVAAGLALVALFLSLTVSDKRSYRQKTARAGSLAFVNRQLIYPSLIWSTFTLSLGAIVAFVPVLVVQRGLGNPGLFFTINAISVVATRALTGKLSDRFGRAAAIIPGMLLASVGLIIIPFSDSMAILLVASAIQGAGYALTQPALAALALDHVKPQDRGAAMGALIAAFDFGFTVGAMSYGTVLELSGFFTVYSSSAVVMLIGLGGFMLWAVKPGRRAKTVQEIE